MVRPPQSQFTWNLSRSLWSLWKAAPKRLKQEEKRQITVQRRENWFFENPSKFQSFDRPRDSWSCGATNLRENNKQGLPLYFEPHSDYRNRKYIYVHICILIDHRSKLNEASIQDEFRSKDIFTFVEIFCANSKHAISAPNSTGMRSHFMTKRLFLKI